MIQYLHYPSHYTPAAHNHFWTPDFHEEAQNRAREEVRELEHEIKQAADDVNSRYGYHIHIQLGAINDMTAYSVLSITNIYLDCCIKNGLNIAALRFILIKGG